MSHLPYAAIGTSVPADQPLWQYGVLGFFCALLIGAVVYLFKDGRARDRRYASQRRAWGEERAKLIADHKTELEALRADYEAKHRELVEHFAQEVRADRDASRGHEDEARREFAELMERISTRQAEASQQIVTVFEKFYGRFVGPRTRY